MQRLMKLTQAVFVVTVIAFFASLLSLAPASAATTDVTVPNGATVQFNNTIDIGTSAVPGFTQRYGHICPSCTTDIDGIVTAISVNGGRFNVLDYTKSGSTAPINTQMSSGTAGGSVTYQVAFVLHGTDDPVAIKDIYVNVTDIDSRQWAQFSGVQEYSLSSSPATKLVVQTNATNSAIPVGAYRFAETNGTASNDPDQDFWAQVKYTKASSILVTLAKGAGTAGSAVFGVSFNAASWSTTPTTTTVGISNYTLSYDANTGTGGSVPPSQQTDNQGNVSVVGNTGTLTKPGYIFDGWNTQPDGNGVSYAASDVITPTADMTLYAIWLPNFPQMQVFKVQKTVDPVFGGSPSTVDYDVTVRNVGNVPLTNINITDANATFVSCASSVTLPVATLAVDSSFTCTYRATPTSTADITNTAVVTSSQLPNQNSNTVLTDVGGTNDLQVYKIQTSANPEKAGETVTFNIVLYNAGSLSQTNVSLTDSSATLDRTLCTPNMASPITLAPDATATCPVSHVVTQDEIDAGIYSNTANATSDYYTAGTGGVNSNTVTVRFLQFEALDLYKAQSSLAPTAVGDVIEYDILATNLGNVELTNLTITDPGADPGSINCGVAMPTSLAPQAQLSCTAQHTITKADLKAKVFTNVAYAAATELPQLASNNVATDLATLANTGIPVGNIALTSGFAVFAALSGTVLLLLRRTR